MSFLNDFMNTTTVPGAKESVASAIQLAAEIRAGGPGAYAGSWSAAMSQANRQAAEISKDPVGWVSRNISWDNPNLANQQINYLKQNNYDTKNLDQGQLNTHNLTMQILGQGTTGKWTGEGFGGPEQNAKVMASLLAGAGISDLKDFGKITKPSYVESYVKPEIKTKSTPYGDVDEFTGRYYVDLESGRYYVNEKDVTPVNIGYSPEDSATLHLAKIPVGEETYWGNKKTGQPIYQNYNMTDPSGNVWQGTYSGHGRTNFGVEFGPDGTPYFYTQFGGDTNSMADIVPVVSLGLALFAPGIGGAVGAALTGTAATTVASQVIGAAVVQGVLAEAQGGDFLDGAIKGAVTAGVAPAVANTVGSTVANVMADSAVKNVVANAVASSAASVVTAALTGGDVGQAAITGALAGAGGSIGRELGTAADLGTTPFSEQTQMLAGQEQGLGTAGGLGANIGQAVGAIASGADANQAILQALGQAAAEKQAATPKTVEENISQTPVLAPTEAEIAAPVASETPQLVTEPVDATISEPVEIPPPSPQEKLILDLISQELGLVEGGLQEGVAGTIPEVIPGIQEGIVETTPGLDFGVQQGVVGTIPEDLGVQPGVVATIPEDLGLQTGVAGTIPEELDVQGGIVETIPEDLGLQEGVAGTIPPLDQDIIDLIAPPPATEENLALDVLGQPLTPEAVDIEPIPQDPLLGLSSPAVGEGEQEAIDYQALEGLSDPSVGFGEEAAIEQANLDALDALSSAEVGEGEQEAINRQALEELSSAEVGEGEQDAINWQALEELSSAEVGLGEQEAINQQALEELSSAEVGLGEQEAIDRAAEGIDTVFDTGLKVVDRPYIRDFYISGGRRRGDTFGPTVTNLSQAISAPFFPSSPVSGLTSYRGAGEIESKSTGKPRRDVWNEASLRLKDALGL